MSTTAFRDKTEIIESSAKDQELKNRNFNQAQKNSIDTVNQVFNSFNDGLFSDEAIERENKLRSWIRSFLNDGQANITDAEDLINTANLLDNNSVFTFLLHGEPHLLIKSATGHLYKLKNYINILETTLINKESEDINQLTFFKCIKLAFNALLRWRL